MTDYRYIFGTLRTEAIIEEIPLYGVVMDMQMNKGGSFQGTFQLDQTGKQNSDLLSACIPGRTWVTCERNDTPIWHGFIWSRVYSAQSKSVQLYGLSFENYPKKRRILQDTSFTATEQRNIFRSLWTQMQADAYSNLNVNIPSAFPTVITKDLTVLATDFKFYDNVMSSIADAVDGFDWYIAITKDATNYRKNLLIGYPQLGSGISDGMNVFEYPGNITQYYLTEYMSDAGTNVLVVGAGEGSDMLVSESIATDLLVSGSPRWDLVISRKDLNNQDSVDGIAAQQGDINRPPIPVIKMTVKGDKTPEFGSYNLGDTCKIVIKDPRWPGTGFSGNKRLLKWSLTPQSSDNVEEAELTFAGDPDV